MPLCIFSLQDLNTKLSKDEFTFIQYLYAVKAGEPVQASADEVSDPNRIRNYWSSTVAWYQSAHYLRSKDCSDIGELITESFKDRFLSAINPEEKIFFNVHSGKYESRKDIDHRYFYKVESILPEEFKGEFVEESYIVPVDLEAFSYSFSTSQQQPDSLIFMRYCADEKRKNKEEPYMVTYAISWTEVQKHHPNPWMIWFIEDYYRQLKN